MLQHSRYIILRHIYNICTRVGVYYLSKKDWSEYSGLKTFICMPGTAFVFRKRSIMRRDTSFLLHFLLVMRFLLDTNRYRIIIFGKHQKFKPLKFEVLPFEPVLTLCRLFILVTTLLSFSWRDFFLTIELSFDGV